MKGVEKSTNVFELVSRKRRSGHTKQQQGERRNCTQVKKRKKQTVVPGKLGSLLVADLALLVEIALAADEHDDGLGACEVARVRQPADEVLERDAAADVVHEQRAHRPAVVAAAHSAETLLSRRVPDLQLDLLPAHLDDLCAKLHSDRVLRL